MSKCSALPGYPAWQSTPRKLLHKRSARAIAGVAVLVIVSAAIVALWPTQGISNADTAVGAVAGKEVAGKTFGGKPGAGMPIAVAAVVAAASDLPVYVDAPGTVTPVNSVLVRSRVDGQLQQVHFREGDTVKAGDLLAQIDPRPFEVQLAQAQSAQARNESLLRNAQVDLERYETLWSQDSISQQELATQKALVDQYRSAVAADRADIDSAQLQLTYSRITSPISGRVGLRRIDAGNIVSSADGNGLVLITQLQPINVLFTVPEDQLAVIAQRLQSEDTLKAEAWNRDRTRKIAEGTLLTFDNQVDPATGTVKLKALFDNIADADSSPLFPNQFVNVRLLVQTLEQATLIPAAAVQHGVQGDFVYQVQNDGTVKRQLVALGASNGDQVAVLDGLPAGAQIVLEGTDRLRDGARVQLIGDRAIEQATGSSDGQKPQAAPTADQRANAGVKAQSS